MSLLQKIRRLLFQHEGKTEATSYPFWFVALKGGVIFRKPVMVSRGIWFSREAAEEHLRSNAYHYSKKAFVYCESACGSPTGLRGLFELSKEQDDGWIPIDQCPEEWKDGRSVLGCGFPYGPKVELLSWSITTYDRKTRDYDKGWGKTGISSAYQPTHLCLPPAPYEVKS